MLTVSLYDKVIAVAKASQASFGITTPCPFVCSCIYFVCEVGYFFKHFRSI